VHACWPHCSSPPPAPSGSRSGAPTRPSAAAAASPCQVRPAAPPAAPSARR
jgi:hypothetical protein